MIFKSEMTFKYCSIPYFDYIDVYNSSLELNFIYSFFPVK